MVTGMVAYGGKGSVSFSTTATTHHNQRRPMNILLCNGKGGTGKTTLTVLLSHALAEVGKRVAVLDGDPQGTATKWIQESDDSGIEVYHRGEEYDAVFMDTPPRIDSIAPLVASCDLAVIVASPSPADLWTTRDTADTVKRHLGNPSHLRLLFNGVRTGTILARNLAGIADRVGVKPLRATISRRQAYQHAALLGWKALDPAAREEVFTAALEIISTPGRK
jgi:chromosome partitioning protein